MKILTNIKINRHSITSQPVTPIPRDDLRRSLKIARPETDESLPHIGVVGDTYTIVLSGDDPGNAERQSALALVSWRTGFAWAQVEPKSKNEARAMVEKGRDILRQLKERTGLTADQQGWLDAIEADLRKMQEKKGATGGKVR
jgi:hypothetical protein